MKVTVKKLISIIISLCLGGIASAVELTFKANPMGVFPFLTGGKTKYAEVGFGGMVDVGADLFGLVNVGAEFGYLAMPKNNSGAGSEQRRRKAGFRHLSGGAAGRFHSGADPASGVRRGCHPAVFAGCGLRTGAAAPQS